MGESPNVVRTEDHETRSNVRQATALTEARRQWEIWNLPRGRLRYLYVKPQVLTRVKPDV